MGIPKYGTDPLATGISLYPLVFPIRRDIRMLVTAAAAAIADKESGVACFVMSFPCKKDDESILRTSVDFPDKS